MSELSSLVKTVKRLQECQRGTLDPKEDINDIVDEMILKAFRIVLKGVRFMDTFELDRQARTPPSVTVMDTVAEEASIPPTPPADRMSIDGHDQATTSAVPMPTPEDVSSNTSMAASDSVDVAQSFSLPLSKRLSAMNLPPRDCESPQFSKNRLSSISHRVSLAGPSHCSKPEHLASERLVRSHDAFLSHIGSLIGRLQFQSQSQPELAAAIRECATAGAELLTVIDGVCGHTSLGLDVLSQARTAMFERIHDLVFAARDGLLHSITEDAEMILPQDSEALLASAAGCVRAAGDCVAKTKTAIERGGDFEFESETADVGIQLDILDVASRECQRKQSVASKMSDTCSIAESTPTTGSSTPGPRRFTATCTDKPLPDVPRFDLGEAHATSESSTPPSRDGSPVEEENKTAGSKTHSHPSRNLPKLSTSLPPAERSDISDTEYQASHLDSVVASSAGSSVAYPSHDSETSMMSQSSTRATTPEHTLQPRNQPSMSELSITTSSDDDVETRLLEKTYAHELIFNNEGHVVGGSLPALVERLTTHEAAPDATFVSAFYLTFRLFCTPTKLAEALIDRFDYVSESPHMAGPVRLRVYNAFKGWLETHWRDSTDREALDLIISFAESKLSTVLPLAGPRLSELAQRVSGEGSLVPRLVSSMAKTATAATLVPADTPLPSPVVSKSQQNMLNSFKSGGNIPTILDFDAVEIARQITLKQMNVFCSILPEELLASQWMKNGGVDAPNVKAMSSLSTDLSNLVADTILQYTEIKKRAAVIKQWIKIANQCLELHNYDGLMAIICSLNSSTISRLRKTWDTVSPKRKEVLRNLQKLVEPSQNNKVLRTRLHDHVPPCLPFLGMYLTDLTFVDIGNPATKQMSLGDETRNSRGSGLRLVNFDKHMRTAKIIGELQRFQIPYRLTEVRDLQDWLSAQMTRVRESDKGNVQYTNYRKSLKLEPRETAPRTPVEPSTPLVAGLPTSRNELFGWMSRDRSHAPAQT